MFFRLHLIVSRFLNLFFILFFIFNWTILTLSHFAVRTKTTLLLLLSSASSRSACARASGTRPLKRASARTRCCWPTTPYRRPPLLLPPRVPFRSITPPARRIMAPAAPPPCRCRPPALRHVASLRAPRALRAPAPAKTSRAPSRPLPLRRQASRRRSREKVQFVIKSPVERSLFHSASSHVICISFSECIRLFLLYLFGM